MEHREHDNHDHQEAGCCGHGGEDNGPIAGGGMSGAHADTASKSLSDALRWSFRILSLIMVAVLVGFVLTGVRQIKTQEVGVKKLFGKVTGVAEPGLTFSWPYPIGDIQVVNTQLQTMTIEDFWMNETPEEKVKDLSERRAMVAGLRPGWDGALFTGDRNLIHVKFVCSYTIRDALDYVQNVPGSYGVRDPGATQDRLVSPTEELIRSAVCKAAIHVAAQQTADRIQNERGDFLQQVKLQAAQELQQLRTGIALDNVSLPSIGISWPLAARPYYEQAQAKAREAESKITAALGEADRMLTAAAGPAYKGLVGELMESGKAAAPSATQPSDIVEYDLIGQYYRARESGQTELATRLRDRIGAVLMRSTGQAYAAISDGQRAQTAIKKNLEGRASHFAKLKAEYDKNRELLLINEWALAMGEIMDNPTVVKTLAGSGGGKTVLMLSRDPSIQKAIRDYLLKNPRAVKKTEEDGESRRPASPPVP